LDRIVSPTNKQKGGAKKPVISSTPDFNRRKSSSKDLTKAMIIPIMNSIRKSTCCIIYKKFKINLCSPLFSHGVLGVLAELVCIPTK
jgi:hypothetical protein